MALGAVLELQCFRWLTVVSDDNDQLFATNVYTYLSTCFRHHDLSGQFWFILVTGFLDPGPRLPTLHIQAQELCSSPWILLGIGEEGGEPIYEQALWLKGATASPVTSSTL